MAERTRVPLPPPRRSRAGLLALKSKVRVRGLHAIDKRTAAAQSLIKWRRDLIADLGGDRRVSAAQRGLIEVATRTRLLLEHVDAHLLAMPRLVNARGRLIPLVQQRQRLADTLARVLGQLGLERHVASDDLVDRLARQNSADTRPTGDCT
jgi:hypothetical protein